MTLLLPIPGTLLFRAYYALVDRLRELLAAYLLRPRSGPRHRLLTKRQIRWQRCRIAFAHYIDTGVHTVPVPHPRASTESHGHLSRAREWSALHPPPRTAQSRAVARPGESRSADQRAPAATCAMPNPAPGPAAEPVWPDAEPWPDCAETGFTGRLEEPAATFYAFAAHADEPSAGWPELVRSHHADGEAVVAPEDWEFRPGDLARWWDEATARLDAAEQEGGRHRLW